MSTSPSTQPLAPTPALPWWRFGMAWFVFALPALVVVASLATTVIAWRNADQQVVDLPPPPSPTTMPGAQAQQGAGAGADAGAGALEPAVRARNHAATPKP